MTFHNPHFQGVPMTSEAERRAAIRASQIAKGLRPAEEASAKIELPDAERGRGPRELKMLDRLNRRLSQPYVATRSKTAEQLREDDMRARDHLEQSARMVEDDARQRIAMEESQALAEARGEAVEVDPSGMRRMLDRDPLLSLARSGAITSEQLEVGQAIRELYDLRMGDAATVPFEGMPGSAHDHEKFVASRFSRAKTALPVGQLETALLNGHFRLRTGDLVIVRRWPDLKIAGMEPHVALRALRWVCCEGRTLTSMGQGRVYDRNRQALRWALDVAEEVLGGRASR